jgi:hypothetical protein
MERLLHKYESVGGGVTVGYYEAHKYQPKMPSVNDSVPRMMF